MALSLASHATRARAGYAVRSGRPAVIAHRGASGHRPEHTLAAYQLAFRLGADAIELDLQATRDGVVVCFHDLELSRTTDVASRPELAHLRRTVEVRGEPVTGWFLHDFCYDELRELRTRERWRRKRAASATFDGRWPVPTFDEVLELVDAESARAGRRLLVNAELKDVRHQAEHGTWLPELVVDRARARADVTWMGFEEEGLRALSASGPVVQLFVDAPNGRTLNRVTTYADGIGVRRPAIFPREERTAAGKPSKLVARARRRDLQVLVWTHRAENQHLRPDFRIGVAPHAHGDAVGEAAMLLDAGIDGLITDFPELAVAARDRSSDVLLAARRPRFRRPA